MTLILSNELLPILKGKRLLFASENIKMMNVSDSQNLSVYVQPTMFVVFQWWYKCDFVFCFHIVFNCHAYSITHRVRHPLSYPINCSTFFRAYGVTSNVNPQVSCNRTLFLFSGSPKLLPTTTPSMLGFSLCRTFVPTGNLSFSFNMGIV